MVVFRFFFVYGAGQQRMLIPTLIEKVASGEEIVVDGDPGLTINPIHVDDAVRAFEPALELGRSTTLNVAGSERITITDLVRLIGEIAGRPAIIAHGPAQPEGDLVADIGRLREAAGHRARDLAQGGAAQRYRGSELAVVIGASPAGRGAPLQTCSTMATHTRARGLVGVVREREAPGFRAEASPQIRVDDQLA